MAMNDWNDNGKNDMGDDFIEYQIYKDSLGSNNYGSHSAGNGISTFGAIVSVVSGFILQAMLYAVLGINVENVPVLVIIILWAVFSMLVAAVAQKAGI